MPTLPRVVYKSFAQFYPFYLSEHRNPTCRRLHFFGCLGALFCLARLIATQNPAWLLWGLLLGYGMAWIGHFGFEKNRPASLRQPLYSLAGNWVMFRDILVGRLPF